MIEINYIRSKAGYDNCFAYRFYLKDYIPEVFFCESEDGAELCFFLSLFDKFGIIKIGASTFKETIWSHHYSCYFLGVPFTMVYDMDYDMISFCVALSDIKNKGMIAEAIRDLIETEGMNTEIINDFSK